LFEHRESRGEVPCLRISIADGGFTFNGVRHHQRDRDVMSRGCTPGEHRKSTNVKQITISSKIT
jgi:hypothetical protein